MSGGSAYLTALAIAGIAGSAAWVLTRTFLKIEELTQGALDAQRDDARRAEEDALDELARQLRTDRDHRTKDSLSLLRSMRNEFESLTARPGLENRSARFREQISQVINAAADQLRESYRLFERSEAVVSQARDQVVQQREAIVTEVVSTVERVKKIVDQFRSISKADQDADLDSLQKELDFSLQVAKRTEERMREIENPSKVHEEFVKE